jgi:fused signal recognition particle receptor
MFGFLKKKLKDGIEKISKKVKKKEEEVIEEAVEEIKEEERIEEPEEELVKEVEEEIEEEKPEEIVEKKEVEPEIEEEPEIEKKLEEIVERIEEKPVVEEVKPKVEIKEVKPEVKKEKPKKKKKEEKKVGILKRIRRKVTEKKIAEEDIKDMLEEFRTGLIESDVAVDVSEKIVNDLKENLVDKFLKRKEIEKIIKESFRKSILEILDVDGLDLIKKVKTKKPFLIVFLGFNGSGKTTTIARIGHMLKEKGFSCVLAAADSWRAAAIEQLEEHGRNLGLTVIKHKYGADPAAVIFDAVKHAQAKDIDVILADTAGRSHANTNLVDELKKIIRVNKPDLKILVLDALTGNDIYDQCKIFNEAVGVDGLIITKADVYEKGGAALSASHTINKPILYLGVGQNYEDLEKFEPENIVEKLLE